MTNYLGDAQNSVNCSSLLFQPYIEECDNCKQAFGSNKSCSSRFKYSVACLLTPLIDIVIFLIHRSFLSQEKKEPTPIQSKDAVRVFTLSKEELHFTVEDINNLGKCCLGLRHVSTSEEAQREAENGFNNGCSLNISPQISQLTGLGGREWSSITVQEQDEYVQCFEKGIDRFIKNCLTYDIINGNAPLIQLKITKMKDVAQFVNTCRFSIVEYPNDYLNAVRDFDLWGNGLGRYPKFSIAGKNITPLAPVKLEDIGYSEEELDDVIMDSNQNDALINRMIICYRDTLIRSIRSHV